MAHATVKTSMTVNFYGYSVPVDTMRKGQMVLARARREREDGDIDAWFCAGCPVGRAYRKWVDTRNAERAQ